MVTASAAHQVPHRHLLALGHRRIALVNGRTRTRRWRRSAPPASVRRWRRPEHGARRAGRAFGRSWFADDATERTVACSMRQTRHRHPGRQQLMAIGALRALRQRQLRVREIALVCFDDIEDAAAINPFLTALAQPTYAMGEAAMQFLHKPASAAPTRALAARSCCRPTPCWSAPLLWAGASAGSPRHGAGAANACRQAPGS